MNADVDRRCKMSLVGAVDPDSDMQPAGDKEV